MPNIIEAGLIAKGKRFGIIASRFNDFITDRLVGGAIDALTRSCAEDADIDLVKVPGAFEIPMVAQRMAKSKKYHAIVCLGAVIRGATPHFDYVCAEASKGIAQVSMQLAVAELERQVGQSGEKLPVVAHHNHGAIVFGQGLLEDVFGDDVEVVSRFVEEDEVGVSQHGLRHHTAHFFSSGEHRRFFIYFFA